MSTENTYCFLIHPYASTIDQQGVLCLLSQSFNFINIFSWVVNFCNVFSGLYEVKMSIWQYGCSHFIQNIGASKLWSLYTLIICVECQRRRIWKFLNNIFRYKTMSNRTYNWTNRRFMVKFISNNTSKFL